MWGDGGVRGLFRGNSAALAKVVPSSAVSFAVFNGIKRSLLRRKSRRSAGAPDDVELSTAERLLAGAAAGASAATCTYPLDRMRTVSGRGGGRGLAAGGCGGCGWLLRQAAVTCGLRLRAPR